MLSLDNLHSNAGHISLKDHIPLLDLESSSLLLSLASKSSLGFYIESPSIQTVKEKDIAYYISMHFRPELYEESEN